MKYSFSKHAFTRMAERKVSPAEVKAVIETGKIIQKYPDDRPYPSRLILGYSGQRPLHVVSAYNAQEDTEFVITVYEPTTEQWSDNYNKRR